MTSLSFRVQNGRADRYAAAPFTQTIRCSSSSSRGVVVPIRCRLASHGISDSEDLIAKSLTSANFMVLIVVNHCMCGKIPCGII